MISIDYQKPLVVIPCRMLTSRKSLRLIPYHRKNLYEDLCDALHRQPNKFNSAMVREVEKNQYGVAIEGRVEDIFISIRMVSLVPDKHTIPAAEAEKAEETSQPVIFRKLRVTRDTVMDGDYLEWIITDAYYPDDVNLVPNDTQFLPMLTQKTGYSCHVQLEKPDHPIEVYQVEKFIYPQFPVFIPPSCRMIYQDQGKSLVFISIDPIAHVKKLIMEVFGPDHLKDLEAHWGHFPARITPIATRRSIGFS